MFNYIVLIKRSPFYRITN